MADAGPLQRWEAAAERILWRGRWDALYEPGERGGRWFSGATLNAAENCVDRHVPVLGDKVAFHWEGEPGDRRTLTYRELHAEVCAFADALRGDRKSTRLNSSHGSISYAVFCLKKKKQ